jgi:superfamily II DNA or RNA helicase
MSVSTRLAHHFEPKVRARGSDLRRFGCVSLDDSIYLGPEHVSALVEGTSDDYTVDLWIRRDGLAVACTCPYFESSGPRKHIWAAILEGDDYDVLNFPGTRLLNLWQALPGGLSTPETRQPQWRDEIARLLVETPPRAGRLWPEPSEVVYVIPVTAGDEHEGLPLKLKYRERKKNGQWSVLKDLRISRSDIAALPSPDDRALIAGMMGAGTQYSLYYYESIPSELRLSGPLAQSILPAICGTGRCYAAGPAGTDPIPLVWDGREWQIRVAVTDKSGDLAIASVLVRDGTRLEASDALLAGPGGVVIGLGSISPLANPAHLPWLLHSREGRTVPVPAAEAQEFLAAVLSAPDPPPLEVPEALRFEEVAEPPQPKLEIQEMNAYRGRSAYAAELAFLYGDVEVPARSTARGLYEAGIWRRRDGAAESAAEDRLLALGLQPALSAYPAKPSTWNLPAAQLAAVVRTLATEGWHLDLQGAAIRRARAFDVSVDSGIDWFDLNASVDYGGASAQLPDLLRALQRRDSLVQLDDGSFGVLPEEWLQRFSAVAGMGAAHGQAMRFHRTQAGLLDALLAAQPEARFDETFARVRERLREFEGVRAAEQPEGFQGQLRGYQCEGLGWLHFLREFGFGGCLADDMGVGKTAQVLALLETRRALRAAGTEMKPSLVVVPRSLVFNWKQEAAKFAPQLKVLDYTGTGRNRGELNGHDLVLTTYGTLRRDAPVLSQIDFDYAILDEAQAIKNAGTAAAKAARLLRARHRLALSGTPVENHIGELWSLFEFLNPGMLGAMSAFKNARNPDDATQAMLARALRPFILRRTKQQVAKELPAKVEQTMYCELEPPQRRLYDQLRAHYRDSLLKKVDQLGMARSKMHVLEALLRLRQAACHPGLIDQKRAGEPSGKLDMLIPQLSEVLAEDHKALVFSQFTSLLAIVRDRLDGERISYEYLDGQTRDRQSIVERFQNDDSCRLFLISLKAGGLGLNLTAADYVFLLDPWWNPAAETQAIDRTHRIGQTRQVFAYRLIARDTIEEKVLELQSRKRDLADAVISADNSLIGSLQREDLELLLS